MAFNDGRGKELAYVEVDDSGNTAVVDSSGTPLVYTTSLRTFVPQFTTSSVAAAVSAQANTRAIQSLLDNKGQLLLGGSGVAYINNDSLAIDSNTFLDVSVNLRLKQFAAAGTGNNMLVTKNFKQGNWTNVTPAFTAGALKLPITWPQAHNLAVGDYVCLRGVTPTQYLGVFPVVSVQDSVTCTVALMRVPATAPVGTLQALKAHTNITVRGGIWDYNKTLVGSNAVSGPANFGIVLAYGVNMWALGTQHADTSKYALCLAATLDSGWKNLQGEGKSDGVKVYGPAFNIEGDGIDGVWADDVFSLQTAEPDAFVQYKFSEGSILGATITRAGGINSAGMNFSIYPDDVHEMDMLDISSSTGHGSGFFVQLGSSEPDYAAASCNIGTLVFRNMMFRRGLDNLTFGVFFASSPKIRKLRFDNCGSAGGGFNSGAQQEIKFSGQVDTVEITGGTYDGLRFTTTSTFVGKLITAEGVTAKGVLGFLDFSGNGTVDEAVATACYHEYDAVLGGSQRLIVFGTGLKYAEAKNCENTTNCHSLIFMPAGLVTNPKIVMNGCTINGNSGVAAQSGAKITSDDNIGNNAFNGLVRLETVGQTYELRGSGNVANGSTVVLARPSAANVRCYSFDMPVDVTLLERVNGSFAYNTNAAAGTLAAAGPVVCQGTAVNSWKLVANTALTY